jgi:formylglycine-generating enzyme required for sulfatase activity
MRKRNARHVSVSMLCVLALLTLTARAQEVSDTIYAHPGQLVSGGDGARLNLVCTGSGSPTVVFDSGWEDWAPAWSVVQPRVAKFTRACSYDRAGAGFSETGPMPRTSVRIANELRAALHNAGVKGPYILVASAFGADNVRTFADLYMKEVAGMVMVDGDASEFEPKEMTDKEHAGDKDIIAQLRECRNAVAEHKPLPLQPARPGRPPRTCAQQFFRGIPESEWSPELNAALLQLAQTKVAMYDAYISEMEETPGDENYLKQHRRSFGSRPIRVLTSGNHAVGHLPATPNTDPKHIEYERQVTAAQAQWLKMSRNAKQEFPEHSSEYIQFDNPDAVVGAIREVYDQAHSPTTKTSATLPSAAFRECSECPEMVTIPAGRFVMGSPDAEKAWAATHGGSPQAVSDEAPQHEVTLPAFALGRYDVTRGEYAAFVRATGHPSGDGCGHGRAIFKWEKDPKVTWNDPSFPQTDRDPAVCISWDEAQAYVAWLNAQSGHGSAYHLPSESEWEYAARAGSTTKFWWGEDDADAAAHAWFNANSGCKEVTGLYCGGGQTHPVGEKPANAFGLYDVAGNVWQWTEDCYDNSYATIAADGRATETPSRDPKAKDGRGNCLRVDRGGSWMFPAWLLRSATRERNPADYRNVIMGFRVARTLP